MHRAGAYGQQIIAQLRQSKADVPQHAIAQRAIAYAHRYVRGGKRRLHTGEKQFRIVCGKIPIRAEFDGDIRSGFGYRYAHQRKHSRQRAVLPRDQIPPKLRHFKPPSFVEYVISCSQHRIVFRKSEFPPDRRARRGAAVPLRSARRRRGRPQCPNRPRAPRRGR